MQRSPSKSAKLSSEYLLSMNLGARTTVIIPSSSNRIMADYWRPSLAVISGSDVRFWPPSGHLLVHCTCRLSRLKRTFRNAG
jgi:hypothetical protein